MKKIEKLKFNLRVLKDFIGLWLWSRKDDFAYKTLLKTAKIRCTPPILRRK